MPVIVAILSGCSLTALDGFTSGDASDAATPESGPTDVGASEGPTDSFDAPSDVDGARDASASLLANSGFEEPGENCGPNWQASHSNLVLDRVPGEDGGQACRVCSTDSQGHPYLFGPGVPSKAGVYRAEIRARVELTETRFNEFVLQLVSTVLPPPQMRTAAVPLTTWWSSTAVEANVPDGTGEVSVRVEVTGGRCIIIDYINLTGP